MALKAMHRFWKAWIITTGLSRIHSIYAYILYELRKIYLDTRRNQLKNEDNTLVKEEDDEKWDRVQVAFDLLKNKIASAPIRRHFDPSKEAVIIVYASKWAI